MPVLPAPPYGATAHWRDMHNGQYQELIQKQGFANAAKQICKIIHGEMTDEQFDQLLKDTEQTHLKDLKKNRREYKRDPKLSMHIEEAKSNSNSSVHNGSVQDNGPNNADAESA